MTKYKPRVVIEIEPDDIDLIRIFKSKCVRLGKSMREVILEQIKSFVGE